MKVKIGNYPSRWNCNIHKNYMESKYGYAWDAWDESVTPLEKFLERVENSIQWVYNSTINRYIDAKSQRVEVKIDRWDTWSMDYTLAYIILPMLKQLKETKHGSPYVDDCDVPERLRVGDYNPHGLQLDLFGDDKELETLYYRMIHEKWEWVMDEMIWAFETICDDDDYNWQFITETNDRVDNALRLFGKYYRGLWD